MIRITPILLLLIAAAGCSAGVPLPKTYPVSGTVVYKGGRPMPGGQVLLQSTQDPLLRVVGNVGSDGSFTVETIKENARAPGAPSGQFQVIVQPPAAASKAGSGIPDGHLAVLPVTLPKKVTVGESDNRFKLEMPVAPPRS